MFFEILQRTAERQKFDNYPLEYWTHVWDEFAPGGCAQLFLTEFKGRVMSAILLIGYGDTVICKMGGWTGERTKARPNEAMHWAGIQWAVVWIPLLRSGGDSGDSGACSISRGAST